MEISPEITNLTDHNFYSCLFSVTWPLNGRKAAGDLFLIAKDLTAFVV